MKLFIPIVSCWAHRFTHDPVRQTWLQNCQVDHAFILGAANGRIPFSDELSLPVGDTYDKLTEKALATIRYVYDAGYDFMLHVGRDTYVDVPRMLEAGLEQFDYAGNCGCRSDSLAYFCPLQAFDKKRPYHYASGGAGSWLSRKAMRLILDSSIRHAADDLMFGWILGEAGIPLWSDWRFQKKGTALYSEDQFTLHLSRGPGKYHSVWMYHAHNNRPA